MYCPFNRKGFSLLEVLIVIGLMAVLSFGLATILINNSREQKFLAQRYEVLDLKNSVMSSLLKTSVCTCQLSKTDPTNPNPGNASALEFNRNAIDGTQLINLQKFYSGCGTTSPMVAEAGIKLPGTQTGLVVDQVQLINILPTGVTNEWEGDFNITFTQASTGRAMLPMKSKVKFLIDASSPPGNTTIVGCTMGDNPTPNPALPPTNPTMPLPPGTLTSCYTLQISPLKPVNPVTAMYSSIPYRCDGPSGNGEGAAEPGVTLIQGNCWSTQGVIENLASNSITCYDDPALVPIAQHTNSTVRLICCKFSP